MDALVAAAKKEGTLNVIALPPDWANYGAIINGFTAKYGIKVNSANPNGSSQDEVNAVNQQKGTDRAPDVLDIGMAVALANTAPVRARTRWRPGRDIPTSQKEPTRPVVPGLRRLHVHRVRLRQGAGRSPRCTTCSDPTFKGKVALNGDPTQANAALNGVMMASLANGGSLDDISKGVDFFHQLKQAGNFVPVQATTATVKNGTTPVVLRLGLPVGATHGTDVPTWKIFVPNNAVLGGYYAQADQQGRTAPGRRPAVGGVPVLRRRARTSGSRAVPVRSDGRHDQGRHHRHRRRRRAAAGHRHAGVHEPGPGDGREDVPGHELGQGHR